MPAVRPVYFLSLGILALGWRLGAVRIGEQRSGCLPSIPLLKTAGASSPADSARLGEQERAFICNLSRWRHLFIMPACGDLAALCSHVALLEMAGGRHDPHPTCSGPVPQAFSLTFCICVVYTNSAMSWRAIGGASARGGDFRWRSWAAATRRCISAICARWRQAHWRRRRRGRRLRFSPSFGGRYLVSGRRDCRLRMRLFWWRGPRLTRTCPSSGVWATVAWTSLSQRLRARQRVCSAPSLRVQRHLARLGIRACWLRAARSPGAPAATCSMRGCGGGGTHLNLLPGTILPTGGFCWAVSGRICMA